MPTHDPRRAPANQRSVRRHNLGVVLRHVAEHGPRSRAAIAQETGLNKTTVSSLVGELIEFGLVRETEVELRGTVGRPALPVELSGRRVVGLGLELGVDFLAVARRRPHRRRAPPRARDGRQPRPAGRRRARRPRRGSRTTRSPPSQAQDAADRGRGDRAPRPRRQRRPPARGAEPRLDRRLGPAAAGARAWAARRSRSRSRTRRTWARSPSCGRAPGREFRDFIYISGELGIGAGIIVGGELFRGAHGFGGELGHTSRSTPRATCARAAAAAASRPASRSARCCAPPAWIPPRASTELAERAEAGDERVLADARGRRPLARRRRRVGREPAQPARRRDRRLLRDARALADARAPGRAGRARALGRVGRRRAWSRSALGAEAAVRGAAALGAAARLRRPGARRRAERCA